MSIEGFRLSPQQKHIWQLSRTTTGSPYLSGGVIGIDGNLDVQQLAGALESLVGEYEILRTGYRLASGMRIPVQVIGDPYAVEPEVVDLRGVSAGEQAEKLAALSARLAAGMDLGSRRAMRAVLARTGDSACKLLLALPGFSADACSFDLLAARLAELYAGEAGEEDETLQYADLAEWLNETLDDEDGREDVEYWYSQIIAAPIAVRMPYERLPADTNVFEPRRIHRTVDNGLRDRLEALAAQFGATEEALLMAVFQAWVHRLSGQKDFVVGLACHGRTYEELEKSPGLFARTLPFPAEVDGDTRFRDLLGRMAGAIEAAYDRQEYFSWDVAASAGGDSPLPFFALNFEYLSCREMPSSNGLAWAVESRNAIVDRFNLKVQCVPGNAGLAVEFHYDAVLFQEPEVDRMAGHFLNLLEGLAAAPDSAIGAVDITGPEERELLFRTLNETETIPPPENNIASWIAAQAARTPESPAVIFKGRSLSYFELEDRAAALARRLQTLGFGPGKFAGLYSENALEMFVGMLAIIKAGGAYLPLDPEYPEARVAFMLQDTGAPVVLAQEKFAEDLAVPGLIKVVPLSDVEAFRRDISTRLDVGTPQEAPQRGVLTAEDYVYVIYTSGSTGTPKGVPIRHNNLVHSVQARHTYYREPVGRYLLLSSFAFDSSVAGIFWALTTGGALVLPEPGMARDPQYVAKLIAEQRVTHTLMLPTLYNLLLDEAPANLASLTHVIVAGEACTPALVQKHFRTLPGCALYNEYGPTEGTVWATVHRMDPAEAGIAPIGGPIPGARVYLLNEHRLPVPVDVPGELWIGGPGVAGGYLNRDDETALRFVHDAGLAEGPLYRTGDLCRWRPEGGLAFLGRVDSQVKIRGYRVELGEVEAAIAAYPGVESAAVLAREDTPGDIRIVAYFTAGQSSGGELAEGLRQSLAARLPAYMLPAVFVPLDAMPLTPNGKVDRKRLPAPDRARRAASAAYVAPGSDVEKVLAGIWADVLDLEKVGVNDNFFELGGHSILVTQLVSRVREALPVELPLRAIFDHATVGGLAGVLLAGDNRAEVEKTAELTMRVAHMSEGELDDLLGDE